MNFKNIIIILILVFLIGLFGFRIYKNRRTYDITVLLILFICVLIRLPIAKSMSKTVVITISLGLAVVTILSYLKTKSDYLKKEIKSSDEIND